MKIVRAESSHKEKLVELHSLLLPPELKGIKPFIWTESGWIASHLDEIFVIEHKGKILGAVGVEAEVFTDSVEILTLVVDKKYQGKGLGKLLLDFAKATAALNGAKKVTLGTFKAYKKVEFYKSQGFRDMGVSYYQESRYGKQYPYHTMEFGL